MFHSLKGGVCAAVAAVFLTSCAVNLDQELASCKTGEECYKIGERLYSSKQSNLKTSQFYKKACDLKNKDGCNGLGFLYYFGMGMPKDTKAAFRYHTEGCNLGNLTSCYRLGKQYLAGDGVEKNYRKANELFEKVCKIKPSSGCWLLGQSYERGLGVNKNFIKAAENYEKACNANDAYGCTYLGDLYNDGLGVKESSSKARELYKKGCDLNWQIACENLEKTQAELKQEHQKQRNASGSKSYLESDLFGGVFAPIFSYLDVVDKSKPSFGGLQPMLTDVSRIKESCLLTADGVLGNSKWSYVSFGASGNTLLLMVDPKCIKAIPNLEHLYLSARWGTLYGIYMGVEDRGTAEQYFNEYASKLNVKIKHLPKPKDDDKSYRSDDYIIKKAEKGNLSVILRKAYSIYEVVVDDSTFEKNTKNYTKSHPKFQKIHSEYYIGNNGRGLVNAMKRDGFKAEGPYYRSLNPISFTFKDIQGNTLSYTSLMTSIQLLNDGIYEISIIPAGIRTIEELSVEMRNVFHFMEHDNYFKKYMFDLKKETVKSVMVKTKIMEPRWIPREVFPPVGAMAEQGDGYVQIVIRKNNFVK